MNTTEHSFNKSLILRVGALLLACSIVSLGSAFFSGDRLDPPAVVVSCSYTNAAEVQKAIEGLGLKNTRISVRNPQERPMSDAATMFLVVMMLLVPSTAASLGLNKYFCKVAKFNS